MIYAKMLDDWQTAQDVLGKLERYAKRGLEEMSPQERKDLETSARSYCFSVGRLISNLQVGSKEFEELLKPTLERNRIIDDKISSLLIAIESGGARQ